MSSSEINKKIIQYCNVLELNSFPTLTELKAAYRKLMRQWHPDFFARDRKKQKLATYKAQQLNEAYEYLSEILENYPNIALSANIHEQNYPFYETRHTYQNQEFTPGFPDSSVFEVFVKSSFIVSAGYDRNKCILYVKFKTNMIYKYFDVPESVFNDFLDADSPGRYGNKYIFHQYSI